MVKKGDYVAFTTKSGKVIKGEYDGTSVVVGKKRHKPPKKLLRKATRPQLTKEVPNPKKAREEFIKRYKNQPISKLEEEQKRLKAMRPKTSQTPDTPINIIALSVLKKLISDKRIPSFREEEEERLHKRSFSSLEKDMEKIKKGTMIVSNIKLKILKDVMKDRRWLEEEGYNQQSPRAFAKSRKGREKAKLEKAKQTTPKETPKPKKETPKTEFKIEYDPDRTGADKGRPIEGFMKKGAKTITTSDKEMSFRKFTPADKRNVKYMEVMKEMDRGHDPGEWYMTGGFSRWSARTFDLVGSRLIERYSGEPSRK
jgi:hypothetical protein